MLLKVIQLSIIYLVSLFLINAAEVIEMELPDMNRLEPYKRDHPWQKIPKPLENGTTLEIKGVPVFDYGVFSTDFRIMLAKSNSTRNIGFYMKYELHEFDFESYRIVFNTRKNERWSKNEEIYQYPDIPSLPLLIQITARTDHFQIDVNDQTYTYKYRMPIEHIKFFGYGGYFFAEAIMWKY